MNEYYRYKSAPLASAPHRVTSGRDGSGTVALTERRPYAEDSRGSYGSYRGATGERSRYGGERRSRASADSGVGSTRGAERFSASRRTRVRSTQRASESVPSRGVEVEGASSRASRRRSTSFMKYASDNAFVRFVHSLTSVKALPLFIVVVIAVVALSLYFPIRDYYSAWRTNGILSQQVELRNQYNEGLQEDVDRYMTSEGIEEAARSELGMVYPGETRIEVTGGDDASSDGSSDSTSQTPSSSAEAQKLEDAAAESSPWYIKVLDTLFFYSGVEGQKVSSTGTN